MSRTILLQSFDDVPSIFRSSRIVGRHSDLSDLGMTFNCSNKIVLLLENLGIEPVEKRQDIGNKHDPDDNRECFAKAFSQWRTNVLFFTGLGYEIDNDQYHKENRQSTH